jgi:erythromycin esterase-like protein
MRPVSGSEDDFSDVLAAAAGASRILLGESTHGTHEYYRERARLTERLIRDHGVNAIAIEGDWSATQRVNLYVRGLGTDRDAAHALRGYTNFPAWMWANRDFRDFVERLRALNLERPPEQRVGLYGMDVYDLFDAAGAARAYLEKAAPEAGRRAAGHYRCFARHRGDRWAYGLATREPRASCKAQAQAVLAEVRRLPRPADALAAETHFGAVRSAASVAAAEEYFRTVSSGSLAWNVRDRHMADNVDEIAEHVEAASGRPAKLVLWSHNTHSGDARATFAADRGELNLGQLMRQRHGNSAFLVGFFSHSGTVFAAPEWDAPGKRFDMRPALPGSYSALFKASAVPAFSLVIRGNPAASKLLAGPMLERAIGVVYLPHSERTAHYFSARLAEQFDAIVYFDRTRGVTPL